MNDGCGSGAPRGSPLARSAIELGQHDSIALGCGGYALGFVGGELEAAADFIHLARELNPHFAPLWHFSGWLRLLVGDPEKAILDFLHDSIINLSRLVAYDLALESGCCRDSNQREAGMGLGSELEHADHFAAYIAEVTKVIGHADRQRPLRDYCAGLLATEGRRSVEPMASVTDPGHTAVQHQKLLHFVANSPWSDEKVLAKVREQVVPLMTRHGPIKAWIIDDTGLPKVASIRSGCIISTAGSSASRPIARWR
jgi:hypothetical protein